jgi:hypothetical protein
MATLYRQIFVWKQDDETQAVRYCCFQNLSSGRFSVQNADFFRLSNVHDRLPQLEQQIVELFIETEPSERSQSFETLQEAINAHDADFKDFFEHFPKDTT